MPRLHVQIKHVTDTDPVFLHPEDIIEPEPEEDEDVGERLRKRRRIETIANRYIKLGRVPLIVSAGLRGPFNNGWKNPWIESASEATREAGHSVNAAETEPLAAKNANPAHARVKQTEANRAQPASSVPSPEAPRAPYIDHDSFLPPEDVHDDGQPSPDASTAPNDDSRAAELSSVDLDPSVTFGDFESNPFWLRRPLPKSTALANSTINNRDPSPTRARLAHPPVDQNERLRLVTPRQPVSLLRSDPGRDLDPEPGWMSSASAPMIITSPVKPVEIIQQTMRSSTSAKRKRTYSKHERANRTGDQNASKTFQDTVLPSQTTPNNESGQHSSRHSGAIQNGSPPIHTHHPSGFTPINAIPRSVTRTARGQETAASEFGVLEAESKHVQQASGSAPNTKERPNQNICAPTGQGEFTASPLRSANIKQKRKKHYAKDDAPSVSHNQVTSPTLTSSTGFMYRKIGEGKRAKSSAKAKPRPITFSSPAIIEQHTTETSEHGVRPAENVNETESILGGPRMGRADVYDVPGSPQEQQQQQQQQSYRSSRTSDFSTQAALLMAQMEFQDGTMPAIAEYDHDPTPWLMNGTPHEDPIVPSPAFTPFHKFNAALDEDCPPEPAMQDMPISTQDLFATVSPFGNSTVKKSTKPPMSNLRFSVFANREQDTPSHGGPRSGVKSSANTQRKPLKDKNTRVSFSGSQSEKGSQESITPRPAKAFMAQAVELPPLDLHTSLDDLRRNSDLDFTNRFLLNVNDMT